MKMIRGMEQLSWKAKRVGVVQRREVSGKTLLFIRKLEKDFLARSSGIGQWLSVLN